MFDFESKRKQGPAKLSKLLTLVLPITLFSSVAMSGEKVAQRISSEADAAREVLQKFYTNEAESICSVDQSKFSEFLKSSKKHSLIDQNFRHNKVIIAGEIHLYTDLNGRLDLIREFRRVKGTGACVAFEWPLRSGGLTEILETLKSIAESDRKIGGQNLIRAENLERMIAYYEPMNQLAKKLNLRSVTVDHRDRFEQDLSMDERNGAMDENISDLVLKRKCTSVLLFVGKDHMGEGADSSTSLPKLLRKRSIDTLSINLQMTRENTMPLSARAWHGCQSPDIKQPTFFKNSALTDDPKLFAETKDPTRWKDFDFTLLLP